MKTLSELSLEKEIEDIFRSNANDIMIEYNHYHFKRNYKRLYNVIEKTVEDFATQQTEKLTTELEQTKEKLKELKFWLSNTDLLSDQTKTIIDAYFLTQLKDNG